MKKTETEVILEIVQGQGEQIKSLHKQVKLLHELIKLIKGAEL